MYFCNFISLRHSGESMSIPFSVIISSLRPIPPRFAWEPSAGDSIFLGLQVCFQTLCCGQRDNAGVEPRCPAHAEQVRRRRRHHRRSRQLLLPSLLLAGLTVLQDPTYRITFPCCVSRLLVAVAAPWIFLGFDTFDVSPLGFV